jgi:hypothetical protein
MLNDATSVQLDLHVRVMAVANHILIRLDVKELRSEHKPAWNLATKDTWIRRGATNFKADPDTIRAVFRKGEKYPWSE